MERESVLRWLKEHPAAVHGDPAEILSRCERAVRQHAQEDAWLAARDWVERRRHEYEAGTGAHASEAYVAREVCNQLAFDLRHHEPSVAPEDADHLAGGPVRQALEPEGWEQLVAWILELARQEEHRTWREIVRYTKRRAPELIREGGLSDDCSLGGSPCFDEIAQRITAALERDFSLHATER